MTQPNQPSGNPPPSQPPSPVPPTGTISAEDARTLAMLAHILNFTLLGPLIIYFLKKGQDAFLDGEAKEALNFSLSCFIAHVAISVVDRLGIPILWWVMSLAGAAILIGQIILGLMGGIQAPGDCLPISREFSIH